MYFAQAIPYIGHCIDDAGSPRTLCDMPANARLIGWQCGFEPMFVAIWSLFPGIKLDDEEAEELAIAYLMEKGWFDDEPTPADYVL